MSSLRSSEAGFRHSETGTRDRYQRQGKNGHLFELFEEGVLGQGLLSLLFPGQSTELSAAVWLHGHVRGEAFLHTTEHQL
jgi:hypothetical protein